MPKSRKSKAKYKDFQKVKLKVGKPLPKGQNETTISFQTRSIQIKEQHKTVDSSQPTTKRKHNIQDLLSQCQHYMISVRHDSLIGLRELFTNYPEMIASHLSAIITQVSQLCLDKDPAVRQAFIKLLKSILPAVTASQVAPFFPVLSAYLCSAMTHIYDDIQHDSKLLLDLLLEYFPNLVTSAESKLLQNFLEQISHQSQTGSASVSKDGSTATRALVVNPNSKLSGQKWRVSVLDRLHRFLKAIVEQDLGNKKIEPRASSSVQVCVLDKKFTHCTALRSDTISAHIGQGFLLKGSTTTQVGHGDILSDAKQLQAFLSTVVPLLIQCWVEVSPTQHTSDLQGNALGLEALTTLNSVLRVLQLLLACVVSQKHNLQISWVQEHFYSDFVQYFLPYFPYSMHEAPKKAKGSKGKAKNTTSQVSILSLNLAVCDIMTHFIRQLDCTDLSKSHWLRKVTAWVEGCVEEGKLSGDQLETMINVINRLLASPIVEDLDCDLLYQTFKLYAGLNAQSSDKLLLLNFFFSRLDPTTINPTYSHIGLSRFLSHLPTHLLSIPNSSSDAQRRVLHVMRHTAIQSHPSFLQALQTNSHKLIDIFLAHPEPDIQCSFCDLLLWLPEINQRHLQDMTVLFHQNKLSMGTLQYLPTVLIHRYRKNQSPGTSDLLSFLFSILIGSSKSQIDSLQKLENSMHGGCLKMSPHIDSSVLNTWNVHSNVFHVVCECLNQFTTDQVWTILASVIDNVLVNLKVCPVHLGHSLLCVFSHSNTPEGSVTDRLSMQLARVAFAMTSFVVSDSLSIGNIDSMDTSDAQLKTDVVSDAVTEPGCGKSLAISSVKEDMKKQCVQTLCSQVNIWQHLITSLSTECEAWQTTEDVQFHIVPVVSLLGESQLRSAPVIKKHLLHIQETIQRKFEDLDSYQWWSEFVYLTTLVH